MKANIARFNREQINVPPVVIPLINLIQEPCVKDRSYANAVYGNQPRMIDDYDLPTLVLDKGCVNFTGDALILVACVREFQNIPKLRSICGNEGFTSVKLRYP